VANGPNEGAEPVSASKTRDGESAVLARIAETPEPFRALCEALHALVLRAAPELEPRLWYGMPAYALRGKVVCFFRAPAATEKHQYMTFGLTENARLSREPGAAHQLLPSAWYFTGLDAPTEEALTGIVRSAAR
jgi:hypothetical protein